MAFGRSVDEIILRVLGDTGDAEADIRDLAAKLAIFSKESADAEVNVLTDKATANIDEMRLKLDRLDKATADPKVHADIVQAMIELQLISEELRSVDGKTANVDVDVQRGALERLNALSNSMFGLTKRFESAASSGQGFGSALGNLRVAFGPIAGNLTTIAGLVAALAPVIAALVGAVVALAASLGAAAAGAGALAVAFGGLLLPAIGLVVAGIAQFKAESNTAGTAANALKTAFTGIKDAAKELLPAVDPVFRAMAAGLQGIKPLIEAIGPVFKQFGVDAAGAINLLGKQLASPAIVGGITALIAQAGQALAPLASIAGSVFRILLNIANAAMPFLTSALSGLAGGVKKFADATGNIGSLRGVIGGLVSQLSSWLALIGSLAGALLSLGKIAAPFGQQIVDTFTKGTEGIRNFLDSAKGKSTVKAFFDQVIPLAQSFIPLLAQVALAFLQLGQFLAPVLQPIAVGLTLIFQALNILLALFNQIPVPIRIAMGVIIALVFAFLTGFGEIAAIVAIAAVALAGLGLAGKALGSILSSIWSGISAAASAAFGVVASVVSGNINAIVSDFHKVASVASAVWGIVKGIFGKQISFLIALPRNAIGLATSLWSAVKGIISKVVSFVTSLPRTAVGLASSLWGAVSGVIKRAIAFVIHLPGVSSLVSVAQDIWNAIDNALPDITVNIHIPTPHLPSVHLSPARPLSELGEALAERWAQGLAATMPLVTGAMAPGFQVGAYAMAGVPTGNSSAPVTTNNSFTIESPGGEYADPAALLAQVDLQLRARGGFAT